METSNSLRAKTKPTPVEDPVPSVESFDSSSPKTKSTPVDGVATKTSLSPVSGVPVIPIPSSSNLPAECSESLQVNSSPSPVGMLSALLAQPMENSDSFHFTTSTATANGVSAIPYPHPVECPNSLKFTTRTTPVDGVAAKTKMTPVNGMSVIPMFSSSSNTLPTDLPTGMPSIFLVKPMESSDGLHFQTSLTQPNGVSTNYNPVPV